MDCQILHMWNKIAIESFRIGFGLKILTHIFTNVD